VPALPGCITEGETVEECVANAEEAIALTWTISPPGANLS
jgi:predicted RNase H-like HicB family nuclease